MISITEYFKSIHTLESIDLNQFVSSYSNIFPLLDMYEDTEQDVIWHQEGNVLIHTQMVINEIFKIISENSFTDSEKQTLIIAAIFHDYAKPEKTVTEFSEKYNRIATTSRHHEFRGRDLLAFLLADKGLDQHVYLNVLNLVGEHQTPKHLIIKDKGYAAFFKLACMIDPKLIYWLELADMRGRISNNLEDQIEYLELFKSEMIEHDLWDGSYLKNWELSEPKDNIAKYKSTVCKGRFDVMNGDIRDISEARARAYTKSKQERPELILMCGLPASGKSTWRTNNLNANTFLISQDEIRKELLGSEENFSNESLVISTAKERVKDLLRAKKNIIYDATLLRRDFRLPLLQLAHDYEFTTRIVFFACSYEKCQRNNKTRTRQVPEYVYNKMINTFQFPGIDEAHILEIYTY